MEYPQGSTGYVSPSDLRQGTVMQMSPHSLDTQMTSNDAVPCFTSQSQGLPAYACKTTSSTDIKLATRMRQKLPL